jgi:hypothetical protein
MMPSSDRGGGAGRDGRLANDNVVKNIALTYEYISEEHVLER